MNSRLEVRQLRYFLAVADELHMGRAAEKLHISQPPLSRQIQQLEQQLGFALFHRRRRRLSLTEAGEQLRGDAGRWLAELDRLQDNACQVAVGRRGRLRVGFVSTALYGLLPALVRGFRRHFPDIDVELHELTGDAQQSALADGMLDLGIVLCPDPGPGLRAATLHAEPLALCLPARHPLTRRRGAIRAAWLRGEPLVCFPRHLSPGLHDRIMAVAGRSGFTFRITQHAIQMQTIIGMVSAGVGVAVVPDCMRGLKRAGVSYRALAAVPSQVETALIWPANRQSAVRQAFIDFALKPGNR